MAFVVTTGYTWTNGEVVTATKLNSTGAGTLAAGQTYAFGLGLVGTPSITFDGDLDTGIYSPGANIMAGVAGGTEAWRAIGPLLVSGGTAANGVQFGTVAATTGSPVTSGTTQTNGSLRARGGNGVLDFGHRANGNTWIQSADATSLGLEYNIEFQPNGGYVGIGIDPTAPLHVASLATAAPAVPVLRIEANVTLAGDGPKMDFTSPSNTYAAIWAVAATSNTGDLVIGTNNASGTTTEGVRLTAAKSFIAGPSAPATNATDGFLYIPACAGTPTGTPTSYSGRVPLVVDSTNNKLYFYSGGAWRDAGP